MRDAVAAETAIDPLVWNKTEKLLSVMNGILVDKHISVYLYMRARPWLDKDTYITSPVMDLSQALSLYARLLSAQSTSWEALRAEWVRILQLKHNFQTKEAEEV